MTPLKAHKTMHKYNNLSVKVLFFGINYYQKLTWGINLVNWSIILPPVLGISY